MWNTISQQYLNNLLFNMLEKLQAFNSNKSNIASPVINTKMLSL